MVESDESGDGLESDDGCCVERVSRILYRVIGRITEQTPRRDIFVALLEVYIRTRHCIPSTLLYRRRKDSNRAMIETAVRLPWVNCDVAYLNIA